MLINRVTDWRYTKRVLFSQIPLVNFQILLSILLRHMLPKDLLHGIRDYKEEASRKQDERIEEHNQKENCRNQNQQHEKGGAKMLEHKTERTQEDVYNLQLKTG